ncbi:MAG: hypothetical protein JZU65_02475 [Chlorobium sp.]|nr:hypothetical protein [Chlorobium sp.]
MTLHPGILALLLGSGLTSAMLGYAAWQGVRIIRYWDIRSGSEHQLELERRTYLVSTIISYALGFQLLSLLLFIYTADTLSPMFIGAMCAAGSLNVNGFGYPTLILKIVSCLLAGLWLIVNATDNQAHDYPLIRTKYWLLLVLTPVMIAETSLQGWYLLSLKPNIITSCCAILFSTDANPVMSELLSLPRSFSQPAFFASAAITIALGLSVYLRTKGAIFFSLASLLHCLISMVALISFISMYIYELPTHHCPFCILHPEYNYIGYPIYGAILVSAICGTGTGVIHPFRTIASLHEVVPAMQKRLTLVSIFSTLALVLIAGYSLLSSNLTLAAY